MSAIPAAARCSIALAPEARGLDRAREYIERATAFWDRALVAFKAFAEQEDIG